MKRFYITLLLTFFTVISAQELPKWALELDENIEFYEFINEGKYLFITSGEYVWCYDSENGTQVWKSEIDGFEEEGISFLLGEMYLTNSDNNLQAYDALTGNLLWENEYADISQSDYDELYFVKNYAMFDYDDIQVGIDLNNGKELYRNEIEFWGELVDLGTYNYDVIDERDKIFILEDSEMGVLYDIKTGSKLYSAEDYDINTDLIEAGLKWSYTDPDKKGYLFVLEDGVILLDLVNNKEIARVELDIDGDKNVILPTAEGAAVMGEEKLIHFNFNTGKVAEVMFPFDDVRTLSAATVSGKDVLIMGLGDYMAGIDLMEGNILWKTKEDDPNFEGYAHKYIEMDGDNILLAYNRALISGDNGTYIYLMSINALTGDLNYRTPVLLSEVVITDFTRGLTKVISATFAAAMTVTTAGVAGSQALQSYDQINDMMGYSNIGFEYDYFDYDGDLIFVARGKEPMLNVQTKDDPGEGFVRVNKKTGEIVYATFVELVDGLIEYENLAPIGYFDNIAVAAGDEKLIAVDLNSGNILWTLGEEAGFVGDILLIDDVVYTKFGKEVYNVKLVEDDVEVESTFSEDPFGFMAIDASSSKILWKTNIEVDPVLQTPQFSLANYYDENTNRLYFADEQNVYALKLTRDGGTYDWKYNFESNGLGEIEYEDSYAIQEKWIGSEKRTTTSTSYYGGGWVMKTTSTTGGINSDRAYDFLEDAASADLYSTYTSWRNIYGVTARKCLKVMYDVNALLIIAPEGIALLNTADGSEFWKTEWDFDNDDVSYTPNILQNSLIYCLDENLVSIDLVTGKMNWQAEEDDDVKYFASPNNEFLYTIKEENIRAYPVK